MNYPYDMEKFVLKAWSESGDEGRYALLFDTDEEINEFINAFEPDAIKGNLLRNRKTKTHAYMFVKMSAYLDSADADLNYFKTNGINVVNFKDINTPKGEY